MKKKNIDLDSKIIKRKSLFFDEAIESLRNELHDIDI